MFFCSCFREGYNNYHRGASGWCCGGICSWELAAGWHCSISWHKLPCCCNKRIYTLLSILGLPVPKVGKEKMVIGNCDLHSAICNYSFAWSYPSFLRMCIIAYCTKLRWMLQNLNQFNKFLADYNVRWRLAAFMIRVIIHLYS